MSSFAARVERALAGRCIQCNRRLPKRKIALYLADASRWTRGDPETNDGTVEMAVCSEKCLEKWEDGETAA